MITRKQAYEIIANYEYIMFGCNYGTVAGRELIDKIYDGFEAHVDDLRDVIDTYMEQAAMYKNLYEMTREEAKRAIYKASKEDTSSPKDCIHLLSLHRFIDKIYDSFEEAMKPKTCEGCKHYEEKQCTNENSIAFMGINAVYTDDFCNDFEPKDNA